MNTTQVLEVLIPMLVMLVTVVGLALRVQINLRRTLDRINREIQQPSREGPRGRPQRTQRLPRRRLGTNREEDRKALQDFRTEVLDRFETTNHKIDANTAAIAADATAIAVNAAETNGSIALNTTKIDTIAAAAAGTASDSRPSAVIHGRTSRNSATRSTPTPPPTTATSERSETR